MSERSSNKLDSRLSKIDTLWSVVRNANASSYRDSQNAQQQLWNRYSGAARRYLGSALRDQEAIDEVMQELALKIVRKDFRNADPEKGSFRVFMKTVLFRMVADYRRKQARSRERVSNSNESDVAEQPDTNFSQPWREELLTLAWVQLEELEQETGSPWYTVLRAKIDHPELKTPELAALATSKIGKAISESNYRVLVHRAREKYSDLLLEQVAHTLESSDPRLLEEELAELELLQFCPNAIERLQKKQDRDS